MSNGALSYDANKGVSWIDYDKLGNPIRVRFTDHSITEHVYAADGRRLKTIHRTSIPQSNPLGIGVTASLPSSLTQSIDSLDYVGNFIYEKGALKRYMFDDGYLKLYTNTFAPRFFIKDHLGNNRIVTDGSGNIQQNTNYYPYGGMTYISTNQGEQQFKYNGKEYDPMHGLNEYDYGARQYDPAIGKFTTMDPLCEKYYHISPYAYCGGNPVVFFDPNGEEPTPAEAARMAAHVYGNRDKMILIGGWQVSNRDFGINLEDNNGLRSKVYERVVKGVVTEYAYVTAGTDEICDWLDNIEQPLGLSTQYHNAAENAKTLSRILKDRELSYIGHSLGGGEAALNSLLTYGEGKGRKAFTFNAAGVSNITKIVEGTLLTPFQSESNIYAFIMKTDPLNNAQNMLKIMPNVNGIRFYLSPQDMLSIFDGHSIESVLKSLGVSNPEKYKLK